MIGLLFTWVLGCTDPVETLGKFTQGGRAPAPSAVAVERLNGHSFLLPEIKRSVPTGWPEIGFDSIDVGVLVSRSFFKHDPRLKNLPEHFWKGLRVLANAFDSGRVLKKVVSSKEPKTKDLLGSTNSYFLLREEQRFQLALDLGTLVDLREKHKIGLNINDLIASLKKVADGMRIEEGALPERSSEAHIRELRKQAESHLAVFRVAAEMARQKRNVYAIHRVFFDRHGRSILEADILIREVDGSFTLVEVKNRLGETKATRVGVVHTSFYFPQKKKNASPSTKRTFKQYNRLKNEENRRELERQGFPVSKVIILSLHPITEELVATHDARNDFDFTHLKLSSERH